MPDYDIGWSYCIYLRRWKWRRTQHDRKAFMCVCWYMLWSCASVISLQSSLLKGLCVRELALKCMWVFSPHVLAYVYSLCRYQLMENSRLRVSLHTDHALSSTVTQRALSGRGWVSFFLFFLFFFWRCFGSVSWLLLHACVAKWSAKCCLTVWNLNGQ